jgi:transposase-like protein
MPRRPASWNYVRSSSERAGELQTICMARDWVEQLAKRWKVSANTIRRWACRGLLGKVHRISANQVAVSSVAVRCFEERYAAILSVGEISLNIRQVARRYNVAVRTVYDWRANLSFPQPDHIPGSSINRWRLSILESYDRARGITPFQSIPREEGDE